MTRAGWICHHRREAQRKEARRAALIVAVAAVIVAAVIVAAAAAAAAAAAPRVRTTAAMKMAMATVIGIWYRSHERAAMRHLLNHSTPISTHAHGVPRDINRPRPLRECLRGS